MQNAEELQDELVEMLDEEDKTIVDAFEEWLKKVEPYLITAIAAWGTKDIVQIGYERISQLADRIVDDFERAMEKNKVLESTIKRAFAATTKFYGSDLNKFFGDKIKTLSSKMVVNLRDAQTVALKSQIEAILIDGLRAGQSPRQILVALKDMAGIKGAPGRKGLAYKLSRVVRSEQARMGDMVFSEFIREQTGQSDPSPQIPVHPNCQCTKQPIYDLSGNIIGVEFIYTGENCEECASLAGEYLF